LTAVKLDPATTPAAVFDPSARPATDFTGQPTAALDGDPATAWSVTLDSPAVVATPAVGMVVDLGSPTTLRRLTVTPTTQGTTIEVYGTADAKAPSQLTDKAWKHLATQLDVTGRTNITLGDDVTGTARLRQVLVYFSQGPDDGSTSVGISELALYR
jgi:hypothetical protein